MSYSYQDLARKTPGVEIDLGRGRTVTAKSIGANEHIAMRRAMPEPEVPVTGKDALGEPIRDEGEPGYVAARADWNTRLGALVVAVAIGYRCQSGEEWDRTNLIDPMPGRTLRAAAGGTAVGGSGSIRDVAGGPDGYARAESNRALYAKAVVRDMLGDGSIEALLTMEELDTAWRQVRSIGLGDQIRASGEGNSGSAEEQADQ